MSTSTQLLSIEKCPLCGNRHEYDLEVEDSGVSFVTAPPPKTFTRLFTCPAKAQMFEAEIELWGGTRDVRVKGEHKKEVPDE